jgi:hypothetical protein
MAFRSLQANNVKQQAIQSGKLQRQNRTMATFLHFRNLILGNAGLELSKAFSH